MENNLNEKLTENTIFSIDMNTLQNIAENTFRDMVRDIYKDLIKLYNVNVNFKEIVINILIENDNLLLDLISHIFSFNKEVNLYSNNFIDIFNKWNNYKEYRNKNQNIYIYLNTITNKNINPYHHNNTKEKLYLNNFSNLGVALKFCKHIGNISLEYKKNNLINNINIAYGHIQENKTCVYMNISPDLYNYNIEDNFKLLCFAISKHSTLYNRLKKTHLKNITYEQLLSLVKYNNNIYKNLSINHKKQLDIITEVIFNTKNAFDNIGKTISVLKNRNIINNICNLTEKFDLNNINNDKKNRNYIYFILKYITSNIINKDIKIYITNLLQNNNLFKICYDKLELYITNMDYQIFDIDNIEFNFNTIHIYYNYNYKLSMNHLWKQNSFYENIDITLSKVIEETNNQIDNYILNQQQHYCRNIISITNKINIKSLSTIFVVLNKIKLSSYHRVYHCREYFKNYHPLLKELIIQILQTDINDYSFINFYDIMKQHYLPELNKLEVIEYQINVLLH